MDKKFTPDAVLAEAKRLARARQEAAAPNKPPSRPATRRAAVPPTEVIPPPRRYVYGTMPSLRYAAVWWKFLLGAAAVWFGTLLLLAIIGVSGAIWIVHLWLAMPPTHPAHHPWH